MRNTQTFFTDGMLERHNECVIRRRASRAVVGISEGREIIEISVDLVNRVAIDHLPFYAAPDRRDA